MTPRRAAALVALGAVLLFASYPPLRFPLVSFVALAPAVLLLRAAIAAGDARRAFRWGLAYGAASQALVLYWMIVALWHFTPWSALGYLFTVSVLAVYTGVLFWFTFRVVTRTVVPLWAAFPLAWTALEWFVGHQLDVAFPWLGLGTSLADAPVLVQWADIAGARGVTLWVVWVNVMLVEAALAFGRREPGAGSRVAMRRALAVAATLILAWGYGAWRTRTLPLRDAGVVGMIQPNEGFREKWDRSRRDSVMNKLLDQSRRVYALARPSLIIWPEAATPGYVQIERPWEEAIATLAAERHVPVLVGGLFAEFHSDGTYDYYNAALFFDSTGAWRQYPVYGKHYLVPVVERVPFFPVAWFRKVPSLERWSGGFAVGKTYPLYATAIGTFGVVVCYESAFEDLPRRYRKDGADFFVNITNDAWFGNTPAPYQHESHLVLRAIETRMGVARTANTGITEFVDPLGRAYAATRLGTETVVADRLRTSDVVPLYVRLGDWVGLSSLLGTLVLVGLVVVRRRP